MTKTMESQEFVKLATVTGERFFLRDSIKSFGYCDNLSMRKSHKRSREVHVVFQAAENVVCDKTFYVTGRDAYDAFSKQILAPKVTEEQTRKPKDRSYQVTLAGFAAEVRNAMKSMSHLDMSKIDELIGMNSASIALKWDNGDPVTETALQILANHNEGNNV